MLGKVLQAPSGPHLELTEFFPPGFFAYITLRGFPGVDPDMLARFLRARGHGEVEVSAVHQVHSGRVVESREIPCEADAVVVRGAGRAARVVTADCVPVLLAREDGSGCAAVHAGWKGTLAGISREAARRLGEGGTYPLAAYIGPAVGPCCYGISPERRELFLRAFPRYPEGEIGPAGHLDLPALNRRALLEAGVLPDRIRVEPCCTACSPAICWSYRRDGESAGRMAAVVGRPGADRSGTG